MNFLIIWRYDIYIHIYVHIPYLNIFIKIITKKIANNCISINSGNNFFCYDNCFVNNCKTDFSFDPFESSYSFN